MYGVTGLSGAFGSLPLALVPLPERVLPAIPDPVTPAVGDGPLKREGGTEIFVMFGLRRCGCEREGGIEREECCM